MDREQVRLWESKCNQEQAPACVAACPMHVDGRKIADSVRKGDFRGGYAVLAAALPLPAILAHICDAPCQNQCRRAEAGDAVRIHALERACAIFGTHTTTRRFPIQKSQKVLIAGGELAGVSTAILLAQKGYQVSLHEPGTELLGSLRTLAESLLPPSAIRADLEALESFEVNVACGQDAAAWREPGALARLRGEFDAVFFEARAWPLSQPGEAGTLATGHEGVFAGSAQMEGSPIFAVCEGNTAAVSIDRFLQHASLTANRDGQGPYASRLYVNSKEYETLPAIAPADAVAGYTREEARAEAARCFPCQCMECVKVCEFLDEHGSYPKRYVREIYNNISIVMGIRSANRMINSCSLCGLCAQVCPEKLNMAEVCLEARREMVRTGKMPGSAHDFALRDLEFSSGDSFTLVRHQPGHNASAVAFLPGCQLSGSMPEQVVACYRHLSSTIEGGVGLILGCCGAPALWAGEEERFRQALDQLRKAWEQLGRPRLITACSSCYRTLQEHLPEASLDSLWQHLDAALPARGPAPPPLALHDPCSTRDFPGVAESARRLLARTGVAIEELNEPGLSTCCGFGGLAQFVKPELAAKTVRRRAGESSRDFVTYCAMCRDRFAHEGKRALHILDLVFPGGNTDPAARPDPGFSERQENRRRLKSNMLRELWKEERPMEEPIQLVISAEVRKLLEERMIFAEEVRGAIRHAEESGEKVCDPATGRFLTSWRPSCVTYWVEYAHAEGGFVVHNAYSHRMEVR